MRFSAIHKVSSYLMVLAAVASLLLSPELSPQAIILTLVATLLSWFAEPSRQRLERFSAYWNIATVVVFFYLVVDVVRGEPVIDAGAHFLLFVLVNKLFNRRTSKDYLQAYVISFLILVVATTMNTGISYAICFSVYVIFATWTLTLLHLRREMEENYLLKHSEGAQSEKVEVERILSSRRVVGARFLAASSLLSLGVLILAGLVFLLFPRIGFGLFLGHKRAGMAIAGFQERVELGQHGVIRDNPSVVMRVMLATNQPPARALRWRGSVFDQYAVGSWTHSPEIAGRTQFVQPRGGLLIINPAPGLPHDLPPDELRRRLLRQEIYLEPIDSPLLFAADRPVAIDVRRGEAAAGLPRRGPLGELRAKLGRTSGLQYVAFSHTDEPAPALLRQATPLGYPRLAQFLQLPPELPARVRELARRIAGGRRTIYEQVVAVQAYLRREYRYTLQLKHTPGLEPVDEFLFITRRGHCEYFASAMTLLLRSLGIHARNVNGFAGGSWNPYGRYLAVRQGDAHAWVEVLFSNVGWVTFDPTPSGTAASTEAGPLAGLRQFLDNLRMRWYRYVLEYDLGQQVSALRKVQRFVSGTRGGGGGWISRHRWHLLGLGLVSLLAVVLLRRRRRRPRGVKAPSGRRALASPAAQLYGRLLALLARAGHAKPPGLTPREFVEELARRRFEPLALVERFTGCYYAARYGEAEGGRELAELLHEVRRALRRPAEAAPPDAAAR